MQLSGKDYRAVLDIVGIIYDVPDKGAMFAAVSRELQKLLHIYSAIFNPADTKTGELLFDGCQIFNNHKSAMQAYLAHYVPLDPFITRNWFESQANIVALNTDLEQKRYLLKSEFGCDFLLRMAGIFYCMAGTLVTQGDRVGHIGFHRQLQQDDFSERDKKIVNLILPHMARAIRNLDLLRELDLTREAEGVIALGEDGKAFYANPEATRILKGKSSKHLADPGLGAAPSFIKSEGRTYRVRTVPLGKKGKGKIFFLQPHPQDYTLRPKLSGFKLSAREEEVSILAMQGLSNREIAERLHITEQTVKDHLHSIFGKMRIRRRSELAAQIWNLQKPERS